MGKTDLYLGCDVGGTHTDAVLIGGGKIVARHKAVTNHEDLLSSVRSAVREVAAGADVKRIRRVNLSTTLSTNAIVQDTIDPVCVIVSAGPGIDPESHRIGTEYHVIGGSIDHRGKEIAPLDAKALARIAAGTAGGKIRAFAAVTKFSTRNPDHEKMIASKVEKGAECITLGHRLSGQLSFPRRIVTSYYNSAVWRLYNGFCDAIEKNLSELGIEGEINVLKADGGTIPFALSRYLPVESILSGPAASVMGVAALCDMKGDAVMLDIGGTTTDIALFADGVPLIEKDGISLRSHPTLVRALATRSIGIGGDSVIRVAGGGVTVGPERKGPPVAAGGREPALMDAFNYLKITDFMDTGASRKGIAALAKEHRGLTAERLAGSAIDYAVAAIKGEVDAMLGEVNNRPVYTIHEMIEGRTIAPKKIYIMGGPAGAFRERIAGAFGVAAVLPGHYDVANAIGAAMAKTTVEIELFADTGRGTLLIPAIGVKEKTPQGYRLEEAERDIRARLARHLAELGVTVRDEDTEIIESSSFNMVEGFYASGKDIRVKCQIKPGVIGRVS
ncbi:MAG: hydantoinase/oxoprolinase family protein [Spirochaetes bacterium]|nr:hydantoinase/oxoprolinase family protein [Spirochaetota bacterium]